MDAFKARKGEPLEPRPRELEARVLRCLLEVVSGEFFHPTVAVVRGPGRRHLREKFPLAEAVGEEEGHHDRMAEEEDHQAQAVVAAVAAVAAAKHSVRRPIRSAQRDSDFRA